MGKNRKRILGIGAALAAVFAIAAVGIGMGIRSQGSPAVMTVDGEKVTQEELEFFIGRSRALVADDFHKRYGAEMDAGFWDREYEGETPRQALLDQAADNLRYYRAILTDCRERGLVEDISFDTFLENLEKENTRRSQAVADGEVIYGNQAYTRDSYFDYVVSNLQIRQREAMTAEGLLSPEDVELIPFYKEIRDQYAYFKDGDGYLDYGSVRERVAYLYKEQAYESYIRERMEKQVVEIDEQALSATAIS